MATQANSHTATGPGARSISEGRVREALKDAVFDAACGYRALVPVGVAVSGTALAQRIRQCATETRLDIAALDQVPALITREPDGAVQVAFE